MAFSPLQAQTGLRVTRQVAEHEILMLPGDPGVTYTEGNMAIVGGAGGYGCIIEASDSSADAIGVIAKTIVCPANTVAFPIPGAPPGDMDGDEAKTLIPVEVDVAAGVKVWRGPFYCNAIDVAVTSWTVGTLSLVVGAGLTADDYANGAIVYIYAGPGKGQVNIISDFTFGTLTAVMHRTFKVAPTAASSVLIFSNNAAAQDGIGPIWSRMDLDTAGAFDVSDGYDDGNYITFNDWHELGGLLIDGCINAVRSINTHNTP